MASGEWKMGNVEGRGKERGTPPALKTIAWDRRQFVVPVSVAIDCLALEVPFAVGLLCVLLYLLFGPPLGRQHCPSPRTMQQNKFLPTEAHTFNVIF